MHYLISYLVFNFALAVCYMTARSTLAYCLSSQQLYQQRLKLARFALLTIVITFWLMPLIANWLAFTAPAQLQFQPFIRQASDQFLQYYTILPTASTGVSHAVINLLDRDTWLLAAFGCAVAAALSYQLKNIYHLIKLIKSSYTIRKIRRVTILLNETIQIPVCFSFLRDSYVIVPHKIIENHTHFKLAIAHELQHIWQKDTCWLYMLTLLKIICFANPFIWLWSRWFNELQEFTCDETLMQRKNASPVVYGQCLLDVAKNITANRYYHVLSLYGFNKKQQQSNLYRRINMLFQHQKNTSKGLFSIIAGILLIVSSISTAYALNGANNGGSLSMAQLQTMVSRINNKDTIPVTATPEVLAQINAIRTNPKARDYMSAALQRMEQYKPLIQQQLTQRNMPTELMALPLTESAYKDLDASKNIMSAAGIWQFVPETAHKYGLVINDTRDDRLVPELETKAALNYLQKLHTQFQDWNLALIAYEIGEDHTQQLIEQVGSRNLWDLARSSYASEDLKEYVPALNAAMIIMRNPRIIN